MQVFSFSREHAEPIELYNSVAASSVRLGGAGEAHVYWQVVRLAHTMPDQGSFFSWSQAKVGRQEPTASGSRSKPDKVPSLHRANFIAKAARAA